MGPTRAEAVRTASSADVLDVGSGDTLWVYEPSLDPKRDRREDRARSHNLLFRNAMRGSGAHDDLRGAYLA